MELFVHGCMRAGGISAQPSSDDFMFLPARHAPESVLRNGYVTCFSRFASAGQCHHESNPESVARVKQESSTEAFVRASFWWRVRLKFAQAGFFVLFTPVIQLALCFCNWLLKYFQCFSYVYIAKKTQQWMIRESIIAGHPPTSPTFVVFYA